MGFNVSDSHWDVICDFMENHREFAVGRLNVNSARDAFKSLWNRLTLELNAVGLGERPVEKWQKTWTDFKYKLKKKASEHQQDMGRTGGGPGENVYFTSHESRILAIMGKSFHEGLNKQESGLNFMTSKDSSKDSVSVASKSRGTSLDNSRDSSAASTSRGASVDKDTFDDFEEIPTEAPLDVSTTSRNNQPRATQMDHDYVKQPKGKKRKLSSDEVCEESLNVLKMINNNLPPIAAAINKLANIINEKFDNHNQWIS